MSTITRVLVFQVVCTLFLLATQACASLPIPTTALAVIPTDTSVPTSTPTATATLLPAQSTQTEFARQADATRQVLMDTQVALALTVNVIIDTGRQPCAVLLNAIALMLFPVPTMDIFGRDRSLARVIAMVPFYVRFFFPGF